MSHRPSLRTPGLQSHGIESEQCPDQLAPGMQWHGKVVVDVVGIFVDRDLVASVVSVISVEACVGSGVGASVVVAGISEESVGAVTVVLLVAVVAMVVVRVGVVGIFVNRGLVASVVSVISVEACVGLGVGASVVVAVISEESVGAVTVVLLVTVVAIVVTVVVVVVRMNVTGAETSGREITGIVTFCS